MSDVDPTPVGYDPETGEPHWAPNVEVSVEQEVARLTADIEALARRRDELASTLTQ